jgi:hypothetical protein
MKKWAVNYTRDGENFKTAIVEGTSYTDAYVRFSLKFPEEECIQDIREVEES